VALRPVPFFKAAAAFVALAVERKRKHEKETRERLTGFFSSVVHKVEKSRVGKFKTDTIKKRNNNVD
jgi:hypothetical protein